jgi:hypothetical protein
MSTAGREESGGITEAEGVVGKRVECDRTGVTGEYGGRGGVPGASSSWLFSSDTSTAWVSMGLDNFSNLEMTMELSFGKPEIQFLEVQGVLRNRHQEVSYISHF